MLLYVIKKLNIPELLWRSSHLQAKGCIISLNFLPDSLQAFLFLMSFKAEKHLTSMPTPQTVLIYTVQQEREMGTWWETPCNICTLLNQQREFSCWIIRKTSVNCLWVSAWRGHLFISKEKIATKPKEHSKDGFPEYMNDDTTHLFLLTVTVLK